MASSSTVEWGRDEQSKDDTLSQSDTIQDSLILPLRIDTDDDTTDTETLIKGTDIETPVINEKTSLPSPIKRRGRPPKVKHVKETESMDKPQNSGHIATITRLQNQNKQLKKDYDDKVIAFNSMQQKYNDEVARYKTLNDTHTQKSKDLDKANETITELRSSIQELTAENNTFSEDLDSARSLLEEANKLNASLLDKQNNDTTTEASIGANTCKLPNVLLIAGNINGDNIFTLISHKQAIWDLTTDINSLDELSLVMANPAQHDTLKSYDLIVVMLGHDEIKNEEEGNVIYGKLVKLCLELKSISEHPVAIAQVVESGAEAALLNNKIKSCAYDFQKIIFYDKIKAIPPTKRINGRVLTARAAEVVAKALEEQVGAPEIVESVKSEPVKSDDKDRIFIDPEEEVTEVITCEPGLKKHVIGSEGKYVRPIHKETKTSICVTSWVDHKTERHGALITGKRMNVIAAKERMKVVIENARKYVKDDYKENKPRHDNGAASVSDSSSNVKSETKKFVIPRKNIESKRKSYPTSVTPTIKKKK